MSPDQRSRLALVVLLGVFLIPVGMSSLRGLTHVLACEEETASTLTLVQQQGEEPIVLGATVLEPGATSLLCGGLTLEIAASGSGGGRVPVLVSITNESDLPWRGTVRLELGTTTVPLAIGRIAPGATAQDRVHVRLSEGAQEVSGALLIGP